MTDNNPTPERGEVTYGDDPTKAVLSESALNKKDLCDYVINVATGCRHGCKFCYVPATPNIRTRPDMLEEQADVEDPQEEWGGYVLHRDPDEMAEKLRSTLEHKRKWRTTPGGNGVVGMSFSTDPYQDRKTAEATRKCAEALFDYDKPVRILTRNPTLAAKEDIDLYTQAAEEGLVTIGSSIPSLNSDWVGAIEPGAPGPQRRLDGLKTLSEAGIPVYVSFSPTYPSAHPSELKSLVAAFSDLLPTLTVIFHEPINPRGANFEMTVEAAREAGCEGLVEGLERVSDRDAWREYAVEHLRVVSEAGEQLNVPVNSWPGKLLVTECEGTDDYEWVKGEWMARSPEPFPEFTPDV